MRSCSTYRPGLVGSPLRITVSIPVAPEVPAPAARAAGHGTSLGLIVALPPCAYPGPATSATSPAARRNRFTVNENVGITSLLKACRRVPDSSWELRADAQRNYSRDSCLR